MQRDVCGCVLHISAQRPTSFKKQHCLVTHLLAVITEAVVSRDGGIYLLSIALLCNCHGNT